MTGESRETEPFQKALMMETGTVIFSEVPLRVVFRKENFPSKKTGRARYSA